MSIALLVFAFIWLDYFPNGRDRVWAQLAWVLAMFALVGGAVVLERGWP